MAKKKEPVTVGDLSIAYCRKHKQYKRKLAKCRAEIEALKAELEKKKAAYNAVKSVFWGEEIIHPIGRILEAEMPGRHAEFLGPFGLMARYAIHFYKDGAPENEQCLGDNCRSITFTPGELDDGEICIEGDEDSGLWKQGSIGELNGMNYEHTPVSPETPITDILKHVK